MLDEHYTTIELNVHIWMYTDNWAGLYWLAKERNEMNEPRAAQWKYKYITMMELKKNHRTKLKSISINKCICC